jgi:Membrane domain of glycerophosphoryl diester phosphodiesterase
MPGPPLDVGGMIEWAFRAFLGNWRQLVLIVLVTRGAITLLYLIAGAGVAPGSGGIGATTSLVGPDATRPSPGVIAVLVVLGIADFVVLQPLYTAAITRASVGAYLWERASADRSLRFGLRRFGSVLLVTVLVGLVVLALAVPVAIAAGLAIAASHDGSRAEVWAVLALGIATLVAVLYLTVRLALVQQALIVENQRGRAALRRSWRLTARRFWKVLGVVLVGAFLAGVVTFAISTLARTVFPGADMASVLARGVGSVLAQAATAPFVALLTAALFFSVRASKEAFDPVWSLAELRRFDH